MLECVIPGCDVHERLLRSGTLHLLDVVTADQRVVRKMVWMCAGCTKKYVVQIWRPAGEQIQLRKPRHAFNVEDLFSIRRVPIVSKDARSSEPRHITDRRIA